MRIQNTVLCQVGPALHGERHLRAAFATGLVVAFPVSVALYIAGWYFLPKA